MRDGRIAPRQVALYARADDGTPPGTVFIPFCYYEAAANLLTNPVLDPFGKIPEFKYCAVKLEAGGTPRERTGYGVEARVVHALSHGAPRLRHNGPALLKRLKRRRDLTGL
jgi:hypothetical protein